MPDEFPRGPVCESCGRPFTDRAHFGTEKSGAINPEYCVECYRDGEFTDPHLTLDGMAGRIAAMLMEKRRDLSDISARELARAFLVRLKRWRAVKVKYTVHDSGDDS